VIDQTEVARMALIRIGAKSALVSLDDDRPAARVLKAAWDIQRQATIREGSFNFSAARKTLPALSEAPAHGFTYQYQLPSDCLRLIEVVGAGGEPSDDYQIEGKRILTDAAAPIAIRYLRDVETLAEWDAAAREAFACRLAWKCGRRIAGSLYSEDHGEAEYLRAIQAAKGVDALENPPIEPMESAWIEARYGYDRDTRRRAGWEIT